MPDEKTMTLDESVKNAIENGENQEESQENKEEQKVEEKKVEEKRPTPEFDNEEVKEALALVNLLKNPKTQREAIALLAKNAGLDLNSSPKEIKRELEDEIKSLVPEEIQYIFEGLRPAISKVVDQELKRSIKSYEEEARRMQETRVASEIQRDYEVLSKKYTDFSNFDEKMAELANKLPQGGGISNVEYMELLYKIASGDQLETKKVAKTVEKMNRNAQEKQVKSAEGADEVVDFGSKLPTIDEAIKFGLQNKRIR